MKPSKEEHEKPYKPPMPNKDFFDKEFYSKMQQDFEEIRRRRKSLKGRPSEEEMVLIACERHFEAFYKKFLHT
jgi:hypothetical protein